MVKKLRTREIQQFIVGNRVESYLTWIKLQLFHTLNASDFFYYTSEAFKNKGRILLNELFLSLSMI